MSSSLSKNRNTRRHDSRAARTHWIYTTGDVLELYGIAPNTLTVWKKMGLPFIRSSHDLYLGQHLNTFHHWFKQKRRYPLALTEVYCVHCKEVHSLHDHLYHIRQNKTGCDRVIVQCPVSGKDAFRIISCNEILLIKEALDHKNRNEEDDYNVARLNTKTAIFSRQDSTATNPESIAVCFEYQTYLKQVEGFSDKTVVSILRHIARFDAFTNHQSYTAIRRDMVIRFKKFLEGKLSAKDDEQRSASTIVHTLINLRKFFHWLEKKSGIKSVEPDIGDYFSPSREMNTLASAGTDSQFVPSLEQVRSLILTMPDKDFIQRRNRALLALLFLSGVRISALLSLKIQHIDIENRTVFQDARIVQTKNSKTMRTAWFPAGEDIENIFIEWISEYGQNGAKEDSPLFPKGPDPIRLTYDRNYDIPLIDQGTIRKIIRHACSLIDIPYFNPHAIRKTLALLGNEVCRTAKQRKAWSQNLGHEHIATTDNYYAKLDTKEQFATIEEIREEITARSDTLELLEILPALSSEQFDIITRMAKELIKQNA